MTADSKLQGSAQAAAQELAWSPDYVRYEEPQPPAIDVRIEEEAAAQAAAQAAGYEGRRARKFLQRRTVDYTGTYLHDRLDQIQNTCARREQFLRPSPHAVVRMHPPRALSNPSTSIAATAVHTSLNKIRSPVNVVAWTPEGRRLLTGSHSGEFTLWNGLTFNFETILQAHEASVRAFEWSKSGIWLVSADNSGTIKYYQTNMNNLQAFEGHREAIRGVSFSPDDTHFVTASDDSTLKIWAFDEAREEKTLRGHGWDVKCVDWHPSKGLIVSGSKDNLVCFWDPRSGTNLTTLHGHKQTVQACKWGGTGNNLVVTASRDHFLRIYDIRMLKELYTLRGHKDEVCSIDWHPIHRDLLVSGGSEGALLYWSLRSEDPEAPVHTIDGAHDSNIWSLAWHPLGHLLASGSNDHATKFWCRARPHGPEDTNWSHLQQQQQLGQGQHGFPYQSH